MGNYAAKANIALFTGKRKAAGNADPEAAELVGIRYLFAEEPYKDAQLAMGLLKELSGGGGFKFRLCHSNVIVSCVPQFVIHLACNSMPVIDASDGGPANRLSKIDYSSKFVRTAAEVNENNHFHLRDNTINTRFEAWAPDFM